MLMGSWWYVWVLSAIEPDSGIVNLELMREEVVLDKEGPWIPAVYVLCM